MLEMWSMYILQEQSPTEMVTLLINITIFSRILRLYFTDVISYNK